jgi:hypothetical protein
MYPRPISAIYTGDYQFLISFEDGVRAELEFSPMVGRGGLFDQLSDPELFAQGRIDSEGQTLAWPNGVDVCPDVLYHLATGATLPGPLAQPPATLVRRESAVS